MDSQAQKLSILVLNWRDMKHSEAGGAEVHFHELFSRLVKAGHNVSLLTTIEKGLLATDEIDGVSIFRLGHTFTFNWEAPFLIRKLMRSHTFDCIIDDVNKIPFFTPRWFPKIPTGVFFHHLFGETIFELTWYPLARYVLFLENRSAWGYKGVPCCTVSSSTQEDLVAHGFVRDAMTIIQNSVDTNRYMPPSNTSSKEPALLAFAGRLKKYKNVQMVLEAVKVLNDKGRRVRFAIAGAGDYEPHLRQRAADLGIRENVDFLGFISEKDKIQLLQRATLFVNSSHKEGWGITNIEANACGTAVIANDAPGLRDSVKNEVTGLLYKENDLDSFVTCTERLLDDTELRHSLEIKGREWAESFSWDNSARKVERWLEEKVIAGR